MDHNSLTPHSLASAYFGMSNISRHTGKPHLLQTPDIRSSHGVRDMSRGMTGVIGGNGYYCFNLEHDVMSSLLRMEK